jgi:chemotaxis protein methyltransferase CheR
MEISELEFNLLRKYLHSTSGIDVPWAKRYLFETRLDAIFDELGLKSFAELYQALTQSSGGRIQGQLVEAMTTNETSFFRDQHPFEALKREILPRLAEKKRRVGIDVARRVRVASIGCSTGEEPYSIAITMRDWLRRAADYNEKDLSILALDISRSVLEKARGGIYPEKRVIGSVPRCYISEYFDKMSGGYRVKESIREMIYFSESNLNKGLEHFGFFDIIFCRNVVIYLAPELKQRVLEGFHRMLNPEGVLILGASESLYQLSDRFKTAHCGATTYYIKS